LPSFAWITPELETPGATSAARPFCATVIEPWLTTVACGSVDGLSNFICPAMKFALLISVGVATRLLTSTTAPLLKVMPLGLISTTCPFAVIRPAITEGSPGATRFSVTELVAGCWKFVCSLGAMLKLCQSIAARLVDWTMSSWVGLAWVIVAEPAVICPPLGLAKAGGTATDRAPTTIVAAPSEAASADTGVGQASALGARRGICAQLLPTTRLIRLSGCGRQSGSWVRLRLVLV